jgi:hypothetical protein
MGANESVVTQEKAEGWGAAFALSTGGAESGSLPAEKLVSGHVDNVIAATITCAQRILIPVRSFGD